MRALLPSIAFVTLTLAVASVPTPASACQCASPRSTPRVAIAEAALIVEARVDAHDFVMDRGFVTRLTVTRTHKGRAPKRLELAAAKTCAVAFEPGTRWLVYAWPDGDAGFTTNFCSRSAPLAQAADDLAELARTPRPGTATADPAPSFTLPPGMTRDALAQLLPLLLLAVAVTPR